MQRNPEYEVNAQGHLVQWTPNPGSPEFAQGVTYTIDHNPYSNPPANQQPALPTPAPAPVSPPQPTFGWGSEGMQTAQGLSRIFDSDPSHIAEKVAVAVGTVAVAAGAYWLAPFIAEGANAGITYVGDALGNAFAQGAEVEPLDNDPYFRLADDPSETNNIELEREFDIGRPIDGLIQVNVRAL